LLVNNAATAGLARFAAARYVVASHLQEEELRRLGVPAQRVERIPNLIDGTRLSGSRDLHVDALPGDGPIVTYVGHFNHVKGVDTLARAFPLVLEAHPRARLALAWSGLGPAEPIRRMLRDPAIAARVHWLGRVSVGDLFRHTTVLALPYRLSSGQAAFPGLVLEAMAAGVPLVTTRLPLLRELVEADRLAALADPDDPVGLAAAISGLLEDRIERARMVVRQRAAVRDRFSPEGLASNYEQLFGDVIEEHRSTGVVGESGQAGVLPRR
jgi:glycosyltransferase involved in cell wall biosynthesis